MRRDVLLALFVLIPVAILISLSFRERGGGEGENPSTPTPRAVSTTAVQVNAIADAGSAPSPQPLSREERGTVSPSLIKNARTCLADQKSNEVEVKFTPTREGRYVDVKVTTQDPYLAACLEDVFEESKWTVSPGATESFAATSYRFTAAE